MTVCLLIGFASQARETVISTDGTARTDTLDLVSPAYSNSQPADSSVLLFLESYDCGYYYRASRYIPQISILDELDVDTMHKCIQCLIITKDYDDALDLCRAFDERMMSQGKGNLFDGDMGECLYYLADYGNAKICLDRYFSEYIPDNHYYALYADVLYAEGYLDKAEQFTKRYLDNIAVDEGLTWDELPKSKQWKTVGSMLHQYAYLQMYKGDEVNGSKFLNQAAKCGNHYAWEDIRHLEENMTFNRDIKVKSRYVRQFDEYIRKYDIKSGVENVDSLTNDRYWDVLEKDSPSLKFLNNALDRHKMPRTLSQAVYEIASGENDMRNTLNLCAPQKRGKFEESLVGDLFGDDNTLTDFRIYHASEPNAFATPYGQIYLTDGIVERFHYDNNLLLGVCAHEATHFICQHSLISRWQEYAKERRNKIWAGVAAGLYAASMVATSVYGAVNGARYDHNHYDNIARTTLDIVDAFRLDAYYFQFKYSREQEIESDIVAYRFCEAMGIGGYAYIMALQMLGDNDLYMKADRTANHPTLAYRILLLKHLHDIDTGRCVLRTYNF